MLETFCDIYSCNGARDVVMLSDRFRPEYDSELKLFSFVGGALVEFCAVDSTRA